MYKLLLILSQDFLDIYRYILNRSMKEKDYQATSHKLNEVLKGAKEVRQKLNEHKGSNDYQLCLKHLHNIELVALDMVPVITGLQAKAERTSKYGFFQYRKDLKRLENSYDNFEATGNMLNTKASQYLT